MLSKEQLMSEFFNEVKIEQKTMVNVVRLIREIEDRKIYLDYNCTSIFQFLTEHAQYSRSAAQRRIDAARLLQKVPSIAESLESGEFNLTQASQVSRLLREKEKSGKVGLTKKRNIVEAIKNKSTAETELILCQMLNIEPAQQERAKIQADESVRRKATFTKEEEAVLQRAKELMSHKNANPSFNELVMEMANAYLKAKAPEEKPSTAAVPKTENPRHIPGRTRLHVFQKQKCCQWVHPDGSRCGSRFRLEIDHIVPKYRGGTNDAGNLQVLCDLHNREKFRLRNIESQ